ncbi:hypothetical protein [Nocardia carnea]|uniref:hypothetical protein n=1 Tax=Nocardia carnea TaxID=37328 RepID=UPI0012DD4CD4|nr:hypothetical protein [Nocardia carnea]
MLDYRTQLQAVDLCGYLDTEVVAGIGPADYIGAGGTYDQCSTSFSPLAGPLQIREITVRFGTTSGSYGTPVAGTPIRISATPDLCSAYIPFDETHKLALSYTVTARSELTAVSTGLRDDLCPVAQTVAAAGLDLVGKRPQRAEAPPFTDQPAFPAHAQVNHPLATLDACAVLSTVAADAPGLRFYPGPVGWGCNFNLVPANHADGHHITYTYDYLSKALVPRKYSDEEERITVAGHPALQIRGDKYTSPGSCIITLATDPDARAEDSDGESLEGHMIQVSVDYSGCDAARKTAEAIAVLYNDHCEANRHRYPAMTRCRS